MSMSAAAGEEPIGVQRDPAEGTGSRGYRPKGRQRMQFPKEFNTE